jgi:hypothetical protein
MRALKQSVFETNTSVQHPKIVQKTKVLYPQRTKSTNHSRRNNFCNAQQNDCDVLTTVSSAIIERYGSAETKRVIESLNFLAADEEYYKDHADFGIQRASSYISDLQARPLHDTNNPDFLWMKKLEKEYEVILGELQAAVANTDIQKQGNYIWAPAAREEAIAYGPDWRTLVLQDRCAWDVTNSSLFPRTTELVKRFKVPSVEVFFARQSPQTGIKAHSDNTNFILTSHLGLDVPEGECWMRVGNEQHFWKNGSGVIADTSFIHSTKNLSEKRDRYVLIIRFWHPGLSKIECNALTFLFDAIEDPTKEGIINANRLADEREKEIQLIAKKSTSQMKKKRKGLGMLNKGMS